MKIKTCNASDIKHLNDTKEYTLVSTTLLNIILIDRKLNAQTANLWQILYNKARFTNELTITIRYRELANITGKSIRTINRYISTLVQHGYLDIKENHSNSGGKIANTIRIRIPQTTFDALKLQPNRNKVKNSKTLKKDKNDMGGHDKNDITNNNIKNKNTKNNNVVVKFSNDSHGTKGLASFNKTINKAEKLLLTLKEKTEPQDKIKKYDHIREISMIESFIHLKKKQFKRVETNNQLAQTRINNQETLLNEENYMYKKTGERALSTFEFNRLKKGLIKTGVLATTIPKLLNEIIFAIRYDSLKIELETEQELSINHAINIAIKLVREKRWETPKGLFYDDTIINISNK